MAPVWLVPLFHRLDPLSDASLRDRLLRLGEKAREPHPAKEFFLYSHPSIGRRVARARMLLGSPD
ncbi:MAG: hypothetical protein AAB335_02420 [candidate division NC10 bacterium]